MAETEIRYVQKTVKRKPLWHYLLRPDKVVKYGYYLYYSRIYLRYISYYSHKLTLKNKPFSLDSKDYPYFIHRFNQTFYNERCVEIPVVREYFKNCSDEDILEVGNVLSHYFTDKHTIIDKFEKAAGVINVDAVDYKPNRQFKNIVSISTIEHIGWDDHPRDDQKIRVAVEVLKGLLVPGGKLIVTAPMGYNPNLDSMISDASLGFSRQLFLKRITRFGTWKEVTLEETHGAMYGKPYPCANILFIGIYENTLH